MTKRILASAVIIVTATPYALGMPRCSCGAMTSTARRVPGPIRPGGSMTRGAVKEGGGITSWNHIPTARRRFRSTVREIWSFAPSGRVYRRGCPEGSKLRVDSSSSMAKLKRGSAFRRDKVYGLRSGCWVPMSLQQDGHPAAKSTLWKISVGNGRLVAGIDSVFRRQEAICSGHAGASAPQQALGVCSSVFPDFKSGCGR
jgi:hypothetical protein